ncbi:MAG: hypothetical protein U1E36_01240 [Rickettsiales bacterium]
MKNSCYSCQDDTYNIHGYERENQSANRSAKHECTGSDSRRLIEFKKFKSVLEQLREGKPINANRIRLAVDDILIVENRFDLRNTVFW